MISGRWAEENKIGIPGIAIWLFQVFFFAHFHILIIGIRKTANKMQKTSKKYKNKFLLDK